MNITISIDDRLKELNLLIQNIQTQLNAVVTHPTKDVPYIIAKLLDNYNYNVKTAVFNNLKDDYAYLSNVDYYIEQSLEDCEEEI
ncbi:MAG: hypothetical protein LBI79_01615 [Nitrososphaerota archaeon]|jgi:precorrin-6B methylase 1|nr:hypothetical protein [Nitrososphaerota archaeon]